MKNNFLKSLFLSSAITLGWNVSAWSINDNISEDLIRNINWFEKITLQSDTSYVVSEFLWSNEIYVALNDANYWRFKWDTNRNQYILQNHSRWNIPLRIWAWWRYEIVLINDNRFDLDNITDDIDELSNRLLRSMDEFEWDINLYKNILNNILHSALNNISYPQYVVYLEKSIQTLFVVHVNPLNWQYDLNFKWFDLVSTWNPTRWRDYFTTPNVIIDRMSFQRNDRKALWTNTMWYWPRWSEIRWLWKYFVSKDWSRLSLSNWHWLHEFHFALHTTTPRWQTMLWNSNSKWCIRISENNLLFFRLSWILDNEFWRYFIVFEDWTDWIHLVNSQSNLTYLWINQNISNPDLKLADDENNLNDIDENNLNDIDENNLNDIDENIPSNKISDSEILTADNKNINNSTY